MIPPLSGRDIYLGEAYTYQMPLLPDATADEFIGPTRAWLERAVIGLNLCPFAQSVHARGQIRWIVSDATTGEVLLVDIAAELHQLVTIDPTVTDTTLLIHPFVFQEFTEYNTFLDLAEARITELELDGIIQVASFHPAYQFAGQEPDAISNYTNRSPYPMLHLLREASLDRALESVADPDRIYEANIQTLQQLGHEGWAKLGIGPAPSDCPAHGKRTPVQKAVPSTPQVEARNENAESGLQILKP